MAVSQTGRRFRFGVFEVDSTTGELRRSGMRVKLHSQPFQLLVMMLERPGELLTREDICRELWPDDTFVDYEHGVNSAVNRLREALGDKASNPRFIETLARRGYRFIAPVDSDAATSRVAEENEPLGAAQSPAAASTSDPVENKESDDQGWLDKILASRKDLPSTSPKIVLTLFVLLQVMYIGFYVGALCNLAEIDGLLSGLRLSAELFIALVVTAAILIPARTFLIFAAVFRAPGFQRKFLRIWPYLLGFDIFWSLSPFLLLNHINYGLALACTTLLVYSPFAQRSLILMGAGAATLGSN